MQRTKGGAYKVHLPFFHFYCIILLVYASVRGVEVPGNQVDIKLRYLQYLSCTIYYNEGCAKTNIVSPKPWGCAKTLDPSPSAIGTKSAASMHKIGRASCRERV